MVFVEAICRCSFKTDCNVEVEKLNALTLNENGWIENNVVKVDKLMVLMLRNICWSRYQVVDFDIYFLSWILLQFGYHSSVFLSLSCRFLWESNTSSRFKALLSFSLPTIDKKHRVSLKKCSPNRQTYALMSRYLRCVIMSHRVSRGGIESNCFRVYLQCLLRCP